MTENRKDFPPAACDPYDIEIQSADEFLSYALDHDPPAVIDAVHMMAIERRHPPVQARQLLLVLHDCLPTFCREAFPLLDSIDPSGLPTA